jgi:hypothetical protein
MIIKLIQDALTWATQRLCGLLGHERPPMRDSGHVWRCRRCFACWPRAA